MEGMQAAVRAWIRFWYQPPPTVVLDLMRIFTGMITLYLFTLYLVDLPVHWSDQGWARLDVVQRLDPMAWPFHPLSWVRAESWPYLVGVVGLLAATSFLLGVLPLVSGLVCILVNLSFAHGNPAVVLGQDALLTLALFYLSISPCARTLTVMALRPSVAAQRPPLRSQQVQPEHGWGLPVRALQIHLCILYFLTGLGHLNGEWISGRILTIPRELGLASLMAEPAAATPLWAAAMAVGLLLFEFYYPIFIWLGRWRYPVLALAVLVHLGVGILWDALPFNLLMLTLNLVWLRSEHGQALLHGLAAMLGFNWEPAATRRR